MYLAFCHDKQVEIQDDCGNILEAAASAGKAMIGSEAGKQFFSLRAGMTVRPANEKDYPELSAVEWLKLFQRYGLRNHGWPLKESKDEGEAKKGTGG